MKNCPLCRGTGWLDGAQEWTPERMRKGTPYKSVRCACQTTDRMRKNKSRYSVACDNTITALREHAYRDAILDAAKLCEESAGGSTRTSTDRERNRTCLTLAAAIRNLSPRYSA